LDPVQVHIEDGQITLTDGDQLVIPEWFQKRWDIDKTFALSAQIPENLAQEQASCLTAETALSAYISSEPPDIALATVTLDSITSISQAISDVSDGITALKTELLNLKLDLQINDMVILLPGATKYYLIDKV